MKKFICLILVLMLILSGCKFVKGEDVTSSSNTTNSNTTKNNTPNSNIQVDDEWVPPDLKDQTSSFSSQSFSSSTPAPTLADGLIVINSYDKIRLNIENINNINSANIFLDALLKNDVKTLRDRVIPQHYTKDHKFYEFNENMYDFFKDIKFDKIQVTSYILDNDNYDFLVNIKFTISKSNNELFKVGESEWILVLDGCYGITNLYPKEQPKDFYYPDLPELTQRGLNIAKSYSQLNNFSTTTVFDKIIIEDDNWVDFALLCNIATNGIKYSSFLYDNQNRELLKCSVFREYIEKVLGVKNFDFSIFKNYNKKNDTLIYQGGRDWGYFNKLKSHDYDEKTRTLTIELDFYADYIYLVKAKTMRYQFYVDNEENLKLVSTENIYNSNYDIAIW